ncbi:MAG: chain length determinant protein tyrosine kinase EpsG [Methylobacter sp.]|uniref:chain length determinant protein tyrosine kinase EpsG n=1 Tax=Methylobacter sp. TaxID=2051955 RepID=UPI0027306B84|nr:chain length determinant protein tyrosine kinase EpsG [Methylobacter sp.]MDP1664549.1 chain length determinant protein tyrosine kinase EpsG [Methylobacter sp.]
MNSVVENILDRPFMPPVDTKIGKLLVASGKLTEQSIEQISQVQREYHLRFGEAALRLGLLKEDDILRALARQFDYSCLQVDNESGLSSELFAAYQPNSSQCEALRALRSQLMLRWFGGHRKALALISTQHEDGSSQLAANLAIEISQLGERTLLIDANLRNPNQHQLFGLDNQLGLSSVLAGRIHYSDAITPVKPFANLSILCAGALPPNPQELLSRTSFSQMLEAVGQKYDSIICDTPPALDNADAQIVAARAGCCVLVVRRDQTRMADALRVKSQLFTTGAELLGVVMN